MCEFKETHPTIHSKFANVFIIRCNTSGEKKRDMASERGMLLLSGAFFLGEMKL